MADRERSRSRGDIRSFVQTRRVSHLDLLGAVIFEMNLILDCSAAHQSYLPIVAASTRASTLHYCCNDRAFAWGPVNPRDTANTGNFSHAHPHDDCNGGKELLPQVLLIDAGCEWDCYSSDSKYLLYEIFLVFDLGADLVYPASSMLSSLIPHFVFDCSHAYNASW
jgi:hypothetical protein